MSTPVLRTKTDEAMKILSKLSDDARAVGDTGLMYAANRAWHQLYNETDRPPIPLQDRGAVA